jgi:hypothetical protein
MRDYAKGAEGNGCRFFAPFSLLVWKKRSFDLTRQARDRDALYCKELNSAGKGRSLIVWEGFAPKQGQTGRSSHPASTVDVPTDVIVTPFDCFCECQPASQPFRHPLATAAAVTAAIATADAAMT